MPLAADTVLQGRYRIERVLETHEHGGRYLALDQENNLRVIVKTALDLAPAVFDNRAEVLTRRIHPNLPEILDHFTLDDGTHCLVMEYVTGRPLVSGDAYDEATVYRYFSQVLSALDYLHSREPAVIHGNIRPENIVITDQDEPILVDYSIDFRPAPDTPLTLVAPEQVTGFAEPRSDVYAVGATLYTLLGGKVPGEQDAGPPDRFSVLSVRRVNPRIGVAVAQVIERALSPKPEGRFETIREMRKAYGRAHTRTTHREAETAATTRPVGLWLVLALLAIAALAAGGWWWANRQTVVASAPTASPVAAVAAATATANATATTPPSTTTRPSEAAAVSDATVAATEISATDAPTETATATATVPTTTPTASATASASNTAIPLVVTEVDVAGAITVDNDDDMPLVYVPAGEFLFGSDIDVDGLAPDNEQPQLLVTLDGFWIDQHEVTNGQYFACIMAGGCTRPRFFASASQSDYFTNPEYSNHPVLWVTSAQAETYCAWAGRTLPSELQWEKAARGVDGRIYPWGDELPTAILANYGTLQGDTTAVGSFTTGNSPYGVQDMAGNVSEWVGNLYKNTYYSFLTFLTSTPDPTALVGGGVATIRNGAWNDESEFLRAASRKALLVDAYAMNTLGFRCASTSRPE